MDDFPLRSGTKDRYTLSLLLFDIALEVLTSVVQQEKELKGILIGKEEIKLFLFEDMTVYVENPK